MAIQQNWTLKRQGIGPVIENKLHCDAAACMTVLY